MKKNLIQNAAAQVLTRTKKVDCINPVLISLHWLPKEKMFFFKSCCWFIKYCMVLVPTYISDLLLHYKTPRSQTSEDIRYWFPFEWWYFERKHDFYFEATKQPPRSLILKSARDLLPEARSIIFTVLCVGVGRQIVRWGLRFTGLSKTPCFYGM